MNHSIEINWEGNMAFNASVNGHNIMLDADVTNNGNNLGPRPKPLILTALAGCTGMDVVSLLKKMKVEFTDFKIAVDGELTEEHPKYYYKLHINYMFKGESLDMEKIKKAIELSQTKYCGVSAMLSKAAEITYEINIIE